MQQIFTELFRPFKPHKDQKTSLVIRIISGKAVSIQAEFWPAGNICIPPALLYLQPVLLGGVPSHHALLHRGQGEGMMRIGTKSGQELWCGFNYFFPSHHAKYITFDCTEPIRILEWCKRLIMWKERKHSEKSSIFVNRDKGFLTAKTQHKWR